MLLLKFAETINKFHKYFVVCVFSLNNSSKHFFYSGTLIF